MSGLGSAICDTRGCPAAAQIRVHIHKPVTHREEILKIKFGPYVGSIYLCQHHFDANIERFIEMELANTARVDSGQHTGRAGT